MVPDLQHSALIVIDMQNHFFSIAGHIVDRLIPLIKLYHDLKAPVIFTQHGHTPDDNGSLVRRWGPPGNGSILRYSDAWRLMPALEKLAAQDERLEDKSQYDAFLNTALEERLRGKGVKTVVITGTLTNLCCETTAREAFCRDFDVVVLDDGCAAASDRHHRASLENLEFGFADVWTISDLVTRLKAKPSS